MTIKNYVISTEKGYFISDLNCVGKFSKDKKNASKFDKFNANNKASFLYNYLILKKYPKIEIV
jgi:hypothetical protein